MLRRFLVAVTALALISGIAQPAWSAEASSQANEMLNSEHVSGEILFGVGQGVDPHATAAQNFATDIVELAPGIFKAEVTWFYGLRAALYDMLLDPNVEFAEPNYKIATQAAITDEYLGDQWGMLEADYGANAQGAWSLDVTGRNDIFVAILDTGIQVTHPDLQDNIWVNSLEVPANGVDDDGNGFIDDINGYDFANDTGAVYENAVVDSHGTHVAGIIGASANGTGVVGVAPNVKLISAKFINGDQGGNTADAVLALEYVRALKLERGLNIVATNNSWGGPETSLALEAAIQLQGDADIMFMAAAGNENVDNDSVPSFPANSDCSTPERSWDCVLSIASIDYDGILSSFTNVGLTTVDFAAPGGYFPDERQQDGWGGILSTYPTDSYEYEVGTSMATPFVTGAAVLCKAANPYLDGEHIRNLLIENLQPIDPIHNGLMANDGALDIGATVAACLAMPTAVGHASVSGIISDSATSAPLSGVQVDLSLLSIVDGEIEWVRASTVASSDGSYSFDNLPVSYSLTVSSYGTSDGTLGGSYFFQERDLGIYDAREQRTLDFALDPVPTGTGSISGRVVDDQGTPVQYINVRADRMASLDGVPTTSAIVADATAVSAADGTFTISNLPSGRYLLDAAEDGWDMPTILYRQPLFETTYVELSTDSTNLTISDVVMPIKNTGTAIVRAQVWETSADQPAVGKIGCLTGEGDESFGCQSASSDGYVEFLDLPAGQYKFFLFSSENYTSPDPLFFSVASGEEVALPRQEIELISDVSGTSTLKVLVRDALRLKPLTGGTVTLQYKNAWASAGTATINSGGIATFTNLQPGSYYLNGYLTDGSLLAAEQVREVRVESGVNRASLLLHPIENFGESSGYVIDSYGAPVEGATVAASFSIAYDCCSGDGYGSQAVTDSNGYYEMNFLPVDRDLSLSVNPPGMNRNNNTLAPFEGSWTIDSGNPTVTRDFILQDAAEISGEINFEGFGVSSGSMVAIDAESGLYVASDELLGGKYSIRNLPPGDYRLALRPDGDSRLNTFASGFLKRTSSAAAELVNEESEASIFTIAGSTTLNLPSAETMVGSRIMASVTFASGDKDLGETSRTAKVVIFRENSNGEYVEFSPLGTSRSYGYRIPNLDISGLPAGNYKLRFENDVVFGGEIATVFHDGSDTLAAATPITIGANQIVKIAPVVLRIVTPTINSGFDPREIASSELAAKKDLIDLEYSGTAATAYVGNEFAGQYVALSFQSSAPTGTFSAQSTQSWSLVDEKGEVAFTLQTGSAVLVADGQDRLVGWSSYTLPASPPVGGGAPVLALPPVIATPGLEYLADRVSLPDGSTLELDIERKVLSVSGSDWVITLSPEAEISSTGQIRTNPGAKLGLSLSGLQEGSTATFSLQAAELAAALANNAEFTRQSAMPIGTFLIDAEGALEASITLPPDLAGGDYQLSVSLTTSAAGSFELGLPISIEKVVDTAFGAWTKKLNAIQAKMYAKNPAGVGKVQFMQNGKEIAWVRDIDGTDPKLRQVTEGPMAGVNYLVRTVDYVKGKNALEIYVDGERVWRAAYTLK